MKEFIEYLDKCLPNEIFEHKKPVFNRKLNKYEFHPEEEKKGIISKIISLPGKILNKVDSLFHKEDMRSLLFTFKRNTLDIMNEEFEAASSRGVTNRQVFVDMVISKHTNLEKEFENFCSETIKKEKTKKKSSFNLKFSIVYILVLIAAYLGISFVTKAWGVTWLIITTGILLWVSYWLSFGVMEISRLRRAFYILARICLAFDVVVLSVAIFLICNSLFKMAGSWAIVIIGLIMMFVCDGIFILKKKQRMAIINTLVYVPVIATFLFVVFGAAGVLAWNRGWLLIIAGLCIDVVIACASYIKNKAFEREVYKSWKED